jgi:uncharacterized membrane protein YqjE
LEDNVPRQRFSDAEERSLGDLVNQVSETASRLVREEIELAKAEVEQKVKRIARGAVVGVVAGFFALLGLIFVFDSLAWGINEWTDGHIWIGFAIVTGLLFLLAGVGALVAVRAFKTGTPPTPDQAIEEARLIKRAIEHPEVQAAIPDGDSSKE